jgi:hypothetical protein
MRRCLVTARGLPRLLNFERWGISDFRQQETFAPRIHAGRQLLQRLLDSTDFRELQRRLPDSLPRSRPRID